MDFQLARHPLVDWKLAQGLAASLPSLADGEGKAALALAPRRQLPDVIRNRAKTGFAVPTGDWMSRAIMPDRKSVV